MFKAQASAINIVVAIIVLVIVALALIVVSTSSVSDLGEKAKHVMGKIFGSKNAKSKEKGAIDQILEKITVEESFG